jgi:hypothetical protein
MGNDPNRPKDFIPGEMYFSSGDKVGKEFIGTPLFIWEGRELTEKSEDGTSQKTMCYSNDRKVGSTFGECQKCHYLPWRKGVEKSEPYCRNYINAFMLAQNGKELVLVRFNKTSEGAGRQLLKFAGRTPQLWYRWYSLKTISQISESNKSFKWYVYTVEAVSGEAGLVPPVLFPLCDAFYCAAGRDYVFPAIARCYADATQGGEATASVEGATSTAETVTPADDKGFGYGEINSDV